MAITYANVLEYTFGETEFTTKDVAMVTGSTRPAKLLSDLKFKGLVTRTGHGSYRFLKPSERPDFRKVEWDNIKRVIMRAPWAYAWNESSAVELWTNGRYVVSPNAFLRVFHILVEKSHYLDWKEYLTKHGVSTESRKKIGHRVEIKTVEKLSFSVIDNEPVIGKGEVISLIRRNPANYGKAEELIED